ncbi:MAG: undecaprenyl-diphosphate phosphatase [Methylicorpusculum sp.]|uniref:undecaprenyl-diphosphate phosphatase n=1 Tax=Methylicorpusculum sp. TaxID=2713644 RepID=UPI00271C7149|nr:undecaprenyl-diphosphate phosphatase [Methylicorpusculum sp.]MDO8842781.1 undecaprenyl-diphosphate phosphatase [Methylicorpusculum sp.]MDO8940419.1 undecaprenyl-diphosphate phosphatase [Methylicorpusculum sp.]MDO9240263.1 undecaprenyl-diphosphate phosphatase [Methylicorpusculum sp.]MDP2204026.1 undecaprenyl-diphosphate phosphatase [Methylicorpusculum sp.]
MDLILAVKAIILGIVEGLTEFLPISSTGHLILAGDLLNYTGETSKVFSIVIQTGAIFAICWEYRVKIGSVIRGLFKWEAAALKFTLNLAIAFMPLAILGLSFGSLIKAYLFKPIPVATAFIVGAFVIFWAEKREHTVRINEVEDLSWTDALKLGFAQALALIPGTSRSGATIIGGLFFGLSRKAATEFSFFLAIPTLIIASLYDLYKHHELLNSSDLPIFGIGLLAAFFSALLAVRGLLRYISHHDFTVFAWYRIVFGLLVIGTAYSGLVEWTVD